MSWSLRIKNGDLSLDSASYETVRGPSKLVQDLRLAILERVGSDVLHPEYGSYLDGGVRTDGTYVSGIIGESDPQRISMFVRTEILRVCNDLQQRQLQRAKNDRLVYGKTTLLAGEVLQSVNNINVIQKGAGLLITVGITTLSNSNETLNLSIT